MLDGGKIYINGTTSFLADVTSGVEEANFFIGQAAAANDAPNAKLTIFYGCWVCVLMAWVSFACCMAVLLALGGSLGRANS